MACYHPLPAFRTDHGEISLWKEVPDSSPLRLPCGGCIGCRTAQARAWALRCQLELQQHSKAAFATLTYDDEHLPVTLSKRHLQLFIKRARKALGRARCLRFFASGEYGETTHRPHYHALLYGLDTRDAELVFQMWKAGYTSLSDVTPGRIAYCAGYTSKKIGFRAEAGSRTDYTTGELYEWQPPFIQMSRRPGIGGEARQYTNSWRLYAISNGKQMPVPTFLHNAWKNQATTLEVEDLEYEKSKLRAKSSDLSEKRLKAGELIAIAKQSLEGQRRQL